MEYEVIRSSRRTLAVQVKNSKVIVRSPFSATQAQIERFVCDNAAWIEKTLKKSKEAQKSALSAGLLTPEEIDALKEKAAEIIPIRAAYYARKIGVEYGKITIRCQKTRWGSCSGKKNLNFNCLLMLTPPEVLDGVIVHELCHLKEMNHSQRFYALVRAAYPEYDVSNRWLKVHGREIIARLP